MKIRNETMTVSAHRLGQLLAPYRGRQRLVLMVGIPGSGKSTIGDGIVKAGVVRLSYDIIREKLFGNAEDHGDEGTVGKAFRAELVQLIQDGKSILVDNTNFLKEMRQGIIDIAREHGIDDIHLVVLKVPLPVCLQRNRARTRVVPTRTVRFMHYKLTTTEWPSGAEGRMTIVRPGGSPDSYEVGGFALHVAKKSNNKPKEKKMTQERPLGYVAFGDVVHSRIGMQTQYAARYVGGTLGKANLTSNPDLGRELRVLGDPGNYHDMLIHVDDVEEFVARVEKARNQEGGLHAFLNRKEGNNG